MIRTAIGLATATALLFTAPVIAADWTGERSEVPSVEQTMVATAAKSKKPKKTESETSDYLVVTLKDAHISG